MKTAFYTGRGDDGKVHVGEAPLSKGDALFAVLGLLDEINSLLGWVRVEVKSSEMHQVIRNIQETLFILQAEVAGKGFGFPVTHMLQDEHLSYLEKVIHDIDEHIPAIETFIMPGGCEDAARLDITRTRVRTLERELVAAQAINKEYVSDRALKVVNRLSSTLFALARKSNSDADYKEESPRYSIRSEEHA
jgi:cob(I)alamin adenosyltransferase